LTKEQDVFSNLCFLAGLGGDGSGKVKSNVDANAPLATAFAEVVAAVDDAELTAAAAVVDEAFVLAFLALGFLLAAVAIAGAVGAGFDGVDCKV
jgi:hypothetical protein